MMIMTAIPIITAIAITTAVTYIAMYADYTIIRIIIISIIKATFMNARF